MERKRDESGRFVDETSLGKVWGVRLPRDIEAELIRLAADRNISPTVLIRQVISEWVTKSGDRDSDG